MNPTKEDIEKYWESKKKHLVHDINIINILILEINILSLKL